MKLRFRILTGFLIASALFYSSVYVFVSYKTGDVIKKELQNLTQKKVTLGYFTISLPLNLEIKNLVIEDMAKIGTVYISPSLMSILVGRLALNKVYIDSPEFTFEKIAPSKEPALPGPGAKEQIAPREKSKLHLKIKHLIISNGKFNFIDHTVGKNGIKITADNINFDLKNYFNIFTFSSITNFDLSGEIPWQEGKEKGKISAEGWLNLIDNDMQATLKISDIDGVYLYPYYSQWFDLEKARIESAKLSFTSNIQGLSNDVTAQCHLELTNIVHRPKPDGEPAQNAEKNTNDILDAAKVDFTIKTKMDNPRFGVGELRSAVEDRIAKVKEERGIKPEGIFFLPLRLVEGVVKGAFDISRAAVDGTFAVGYEFKNAVTGSFIKQPPPPAPKPKEEVKEAPKEVPKETKK